MLGTRTSQCAILEDAEINEIIKEIRNLWQNVVMVRGSACHSHSNGLVERLNALVEKKLGHWMRDNNSTSSWSVGIPIIQWRMRNTQINRST